ncbi:hypothetical protein BgiBS90_014695 [Biomphalaria glabrata]|nr:hypothetical protein BgiBS90_014695 [Biomphalaria glabrata]
MNDKQDELQNAWEVTDFCRKANVLNTFPFKRPGLIRYRNLLPPDVYTFDHCPLLAFRRNRKSHLGRPELSRSSSNVIHPLPRDFSRAKPPSHVVSLQVDQYIATVSALPSDELIARRARVLGIYTFS